MPDLIVSSKVPPVGAQNLGAPRSKWYQRSPIGNLLLLIFALETAFVKVPIRAILLVLFPRWMKARKNWPFGRELLIYAARRLDYYRTHLHQPYKRIDKGVLPSVSPKKGATADWIQPVHRQSGLSGEIKTWFDAGGCTTMRIPAFWYGENHAGESGRDAKANEKVILFFHGGAYREISAHPDSPSAPNVKLALKAAKQSKFPNAPRRALAVEYRLSAEGATFPSILADALASWQYLVRELRFEPKNIIFLGDSAGGNLALALMRYLRDERPLWKELGLPYDSDIAGGVILVSPWIDVSGSFAQAGPSSSARRYAGIDYLQSELLENARLDLVKGLPVQAIYSRWISPISTERDLEEDLFDYFPRTLCIYGEFEILVDEIEAFAQRFQMGRSTGKLTMYKEPDAVHDYIAVPLTFSKEHRNATNEMAKWFSDGE